MYSCTKLHTSIKKNLKTSAWIQKHFIEQYSSLWATTSHYLINHIQISLGPSTHGKRLYPVYWVVRSPLRTEDPFFRATLFRTYDFLWLPFWNYHRECSLSGVTISAPPLIWDRPLSRTKIQYHATIHDLSWGFKIMF